MTERRVPDPLWLHPDDDLAPNRPGESLYAVAAQRPGSRAADRLARLLGRPSPAREAADRLAAAQRVGERLERLTGAGWWVLHALPLPGGAELDHLLIGPGGAFAVHGGWWPGARVEVDEDVVRHGRRTTPLVRHCVRAAALAAHALTRADGAEVPVRAVLVPVGVAGIEVRPGVAERVRVLRENELGGFARRGGVLTPAAAERLHGFARDRRTWHGL